MSFFVFYLAQEMECGIFGTRGSWQPLDPLEIWHCDNMDIEARHAKYGIFHCSNVKYSIGIACTIRVVLNFAVVNM